MLDDLYQQLILEESKEPSNLLAKFDKPEINISRLKEKCKNAAIVRELNPSCGDEIYAAVTKENNKILDVKWIGTGCSISMAASSIVSTLLIDKDILEASKIIDEYILFIKGEEIEVEQDLKALKGVRKYPARVKCALLGAESFLRGIKE